MGGENCDVNEMGMLRLREKRIIAEVDGAKEVGRVCLSLLKSPEEEVICGDLKIGCESQRERSGYLTPATRLQ